jgi:hypothetical protein
MSFIEPNTPGYYTTKVKAQLQELIDQLRAGGEKIEDNEASKLFNDCEITLKEMLGKFERFENVRQD